MTEQEYLWYEAQIQACAAEAFNTYGFQLLKDLAQFVPWSWGGDSVTAQLDSVDTIAPGIKACALNTAVERLEGELPTAFSLSQNYPNPFNPTTTISFALPETAEAMLSVFDLLGRQIRLLAAGTQPAGTYEVTFDATFVPSGVYFYRLEARDFVETLRMVVVR